jgi:hypothetical protein
MAKMLPTPLPAVSAPKGLLCYAALHTDAGMLLATCAYASNTECRLAEWHAAGFSHPLLRAAMSEPLCGTSVSAVCPASCRQPCLNDSHEAYLLLCCSWRTSCAASAMRSCAD